MNVCMSVYYGCMYECIHMLFLHVWVYSHRNVCMSNFACCTYMYECIHIWMYVVVRTHVVPNMYVWMYVKVYTMNICMSVFTCCTYMYGYIHIWTCVVVYSHSVRDSYLKNVCTNIYYECMHECIHMLYLYVWDSHTNVCMRVYTLCN